MAQRTLCSLRSIAWLALLGLLAASATAQSSPGRRGHAPSVKIELSPSDWVEPETELAIRVIVDDPDGDLVTARLELGLPGLFMRPIRDEAPPVVRKMTWFANQYTAGRHHLAVKAWDDSPGKLRTVATVAIDIGGRQAAAMNLFDIDGDHDYEMVVSAPALAVAGQTGAGALLAFDELGATSGTGFSTTTFHAASPQANAALGGIPGVWQADVDGDGLCDLLAPTTTSGGGEWHVWFGLRGAPRDRPADATLVAGPASDLGDAAVRFHDVTGDGLEDVILLASYDSTSKSYGGAIHVFAGGPGLVGIVSPTATLTDSSPHAFDFFPAHVAFGDVTGDGFDDLVATAPYADVANRKDQGKCDLFVGGPAMVGAVAPLARLSGAAQAFSYLGDVQKSAGLWLVDFDHDGLRDILVGSTRAGSGGAIYFWKGRAGISGLPAADATLAVSTGKVGDSLGYMRSGDGVQFTDIDGDGYVDLLAATSNAATPTGGGSGLIYVFKGGTSIVGTIDASARLGETIAQPSREFIGVHCDHGWRIADVTGDRQPDVIAVGTHDVAGVVEAGAVYVFAGGAGITGSVAPLATLVDSAPSAYDQLGYASLGGGSGNGFQIAEVTGDGAPDLVVPAAWADVGGVVSAGKLLVFACGPALSGTTYPTATLVEPAPSAIDRLAGGSEAGFRLADVTGDGIADIIARAPQAAVGSVDVGAVFVFEGGAPLQGTPAPRADLYGSTVGSKLASGRFGVELSDFNHDGVLDLLITEPRGYRTGFSERGGAFLVLGGASLSSPMVPVAVLQRPGGVNGDAVFDCGTYDTLWLHDLDGDGTDDVIVPCPAADRRVPPSAVDSGALLWWRDGRPARPGNYLELTSPQPIANSHFSAWW